MRTPSEILPGVFVSTCDLYSTNSTVVAADTGAHCLVVDPGVTTADLTSLVADLADLGLAPAAGFSTHPHWDHVIWHPSLGDVPRYSSELAAAVADRERDDLIEGVQKAAPGHDLEVFARLTPLEPGVKTVPWVGPEALVITHNGHAPGHSALFLLGTGTLIAGDMCSDIEIPLLDRDQPDPIGDYRAGLALLAALPVRTVIPGHGSVTDAAGFRDRIDADLKYLDALEQGTEPDDARLTSDWLLAEHAAQARRTHR